MLRYGTAAVWIGLMSLSLGCANVDQGDPRSADEPVPDTAPEEDTTEDSTVEDTAPPEPLCDGERISMEAVEQMLVLTELTSSETVYSTYDRIDGIATLFEDCGDPWGMFPTTYRHITNLSLIHI